MREMGNPRQLLKTTSDWKALYCKFYDQETFFMLC